MALQFIVAKGQNILQIWMPMRSGYENFKACMTYVVSDPQLTSFIASEMIITKIVVKQLLNSDAILPLT